MYVVCTQMLEPVDERSMLECVGSNMCACIYRNAFAYNGTYFCFQIRTTGHRMVQLWIIRTVPTESFRLTFRNFHHIYFSASLLCTKHSHPHMHACVSRTSDVKFCTFAMHLSDTTDTQFNARNFRWVCYHFDRLSISHGGLSSLLSYEFH